MSAIISSWLNSPEIRISKPVTANDLDKAFQSGYLLGELMVKLDIISMTQFQDHFSGAKTMEAHIDNYTVIERVLREKLDIRLSSNFAFDLITGKPGCAARFLYQIKSNLVNKPKTAANLSKDLGDLDKRKPFPSRLPAMSPSSRPSSSESHENEKLVKFEQDSNFSSYPSSPTVFKNNLPLH